MITPAEKKNWLIGSTIWKILHMMKTIQSLKDSSELRWDDLPEAAKASIERGLEDSRAGRIYPHEEARKIYKNGFKGFLDRGSEEKFRSNNSISGATLDRARIASVFLGL